MAIKLKFRVESINEMSIYHDVKFCSSGADNTVFSRSSHDLREALNAQSLGMSRHQVVKKIVQNEK